MIMRRKYMLVDTKVRKYVDLRHHENAIQAAYDKVFGSGQVRVEVKEGYYYVYGDIINEQALQVGHNIASFTPLKQYCKIWGGKSYLFKCYEMVSVSCPV